MVSAGFEMIWGLSGLMDREENVSGQSAATLASTSSSSGGKGGDGIPSMPRSSLQHVSEELLRPDARFQGLRVLR